MTNDIFLQNRLIQTSQTGDQQYSDTSPFSIPWLEFYMTVGSKGLQSTDTLAYWAHSEAVKKMNSCESGPRYRTCTLFFQLINALAYIGLITAVKSFTVSTP